MPTSYHTESQSNCGDNKPSHRERAMNSHRLLFLLIAVLFAFPEALPADVVHLKSGVTIEGKVVDLGDQIKVEMKFGSRTIPKQKILRIETAKSTREEFQRKLKTLDPENIEQHLTLAEWCEPRSLKEEAKLCLERVLAENPDHDFARDKLGYKMGPHGRWRVKCKTCSGIGTIREPCDKCKNGKIDCYKCGGKGVLYHACTATGCNGGRVECPKCRGHRSRWTKRLHSGQSMVVYCPVCGGKGTVDCKQCKGGRVRVLCTNCKNGKIQCTACDGKGYTEKRCPTCGGSGIQP